MRERNFAGIADARRVFNSRVERAKEAMKNDLETIKVTNVEGGGGHPAKAATLAATREYGRAIHDAWNEYLAATTDGDIPDDDAGRIAYAEADLARRVAAMNGGGRNDEAF